MGAARMGTETVATLLARARVMPTIALERADDALPLAETLQDAGIALMEITLRTPAGMPAIRALAARRDLRIGIAAGTLRTADELRAAHDAGAVLLVSPGHTASLLDLAGRLQLPWLPGCATPSEVTLLLEHGWRVQKLFPALPGLLDALAGPFADVQFVPTGGVTADNAPALLAQPGVIAVSGTWIAPRALIAARDWAAIATRASAAARVVERLASQ
jgi:2-dehydro-3-deoxyphosphogluconate aldolase/(4S)-4-hydroxy-2-oxoglutarate aldolase